MFDGENSLGLTATCKWNKAWVLKFSTLTCKTTDFVVEIKVNFWAGKDWKLLADKKIGRFY